MKYTFLYNGKVCCDLFLSWKLANSKNKLSKIEVMLDNWQT